MLRSSTLILFVGMLTAVLAVATLSVGCGGGGGGETSGTGTTTPSITASVLSWAPPETTADNTAIDPYQELDYYEIYVREDGNFTDNDPPAGQVSAVEDYRSADGQTVSQALVKEFRLDLLPNVPAASRLYVSMRAVGPDRQKSDFMEPVVWERS